MGIPFTVPMGFLFTMTIGFLFTIALAIQLTISNPECPPGDDRGIWRFGTLGSFSAGNTARPEAQDVYI